MITSFFGPSIFAVTLFLGIAVSSLIPLASATADSAIAPVANRLGLFPAYETRSDGEVEIVFLGERATSTGTYLDFRVINRSQETATYWSELTDGPENYILEIDGAEQNMRWCGNGQTQKTLYPGYAVDVSIFRPVIDGMLPAEGGEVRIGYYFCLGERSQKAFARPRWMKRGEETRKTEP